MQNWPAGNVSSNVVSGTKRMSMLSLIISFRGLNLFLIKFMFILPIISLKCKVENEILLNCLSG